MCLRVAVPGAVGAVWATTPIGGANLTMTARPGRTSWQSRGAQGNYRHTGTGAPGKLGDVRPRRISHQDRAARANRTNRPGNRSTPAVARVSG